MAVSQEQKQAVRELVTKEQYQAMEKALDDPTTDLQIEALNELLGPDEIRWRIGSGGLLIAYIETAKAMDLANNIFGTQNWGYEVLECENKPVVNPNTKDGVPVGSFYWARVRVEVEGYKPRTDVGGQEVTPPYKDSDGRAWAEAEVNAMKAAASDGIKRALHSFGLKLGLCLYSDKYQDQLLAQFGYQAAEADANSVKDKRQRQNAIKERHARRPVAPRPQPQIAQERPENGKTAPVSHVEKPAPVPTTVNGSAVPTPRPENNAQITSEQISTIKTLSEARKLSAKRVDKTCEARFGVANLNNLNTGQADELIELIKAIPVSTEADAPKF